MIYVHIAQRVKREGLLVNLMGCKNVKSEVILGV